MVGVHEKVSDKPDSFPDHTEINSTAVMAPSINLKAQCRKCRAEVKCCLMIQNDFTAGLVTCSLLTLVVLRTLYSEILRKSFDISENQNTHTVTILDYISTVFFL